MLFIIKKKNIVQRQKTFQNLFTYAIICGIIMVSEEHPQNKRRKTK
nr:MAG TPA: hypothetical protein [Caudoviricetes sp.]